MPALLDSLLAGHELVAEGQHAFTIAHHHCEVAEQWAFLEVPVLTGDSREALAIERSATSPALKRCLAQPLAAIDCELYRPYFVFEPGLVRTRALAFRSELTFVHELRSSDGGEKHGVVVERYI
jgi:hypothetical protein